MDNSWLTPELRALVDRQAIVECPPGTVAAFTVPIGDAGVVLAYHSRAHRQHRLWGHRALRC
jgi:hypothetical protein